MLQAYSIVLSAHNILLNVSTVVLSPSTNVLRLNFQQYRAIVALELYKSFIDSSIAKPSDPNSTEADLPLSGLHYACAAHMQISNGVR